MTFTTVSTDYWDWETVDINKSSTLPSVDEICKTISMLNRHKSADITNNVADFLKNKTSSPIPEMGSVLISYSPSCILIEPYCESFFEMFNLFQY